MRYEDIISEAKRLRKEQRLTLAEVGEVMGCDGTYISRIETMRIIPSAEVLVKYLTVINIQIRLDSGALLVPRCGDVAQGS